MKFSVVKGIWRGTRCHATTMGAILGLARRHYTTIRLNDTPEHGANFRKCFLSKARDRASAVCPRANSEGYAGRPRLLLAAASKPLASLTNRLANLSQRHDLALFFFLNQNVGDKRTWSTQRTNIDLYGGAMLVHASAPCHAFCDHVLKMHGRRYTHSKAHSTVSEWLVAFLSPTTSAGGGSA